jgi:hypothetical protein
MIAYGRLSTAALPVLQGHQNHSLRSRIFKHLFDVLLWRVISMFRQFNTIKHAGVLGVQ